MTEARTSVIDEEGYLSEAIHPRRKIRTLYDVKRELREMSVKDPKHSTLVEERDRLRGQAHVDEIISITLKLETGLEKRKGRKMPITPSKRKVLIQRHSQLISRVI